MYKILIFIPLLYLVNSAVAEKVMITKEYSAEAIYYIPGMDVEDKHPENPYSKDSLKGPFEIALIKRLQSMSVTFPEGSSIKVHRKKETVEFVNTERNHQRILYLVQNHEIYNRKLSIESRVKVYDISDKRVLAKISKKFDPDKFANLLGVKEIASLLLKSANNEDGKLKVKNRELFINGRINARSLKGKFSVKLILDKGVKDKELFFQTTFIASMNDPRIVFLSDNEGHLKCAVFEFKFKDLDVQKLMPLKVLAPKPENDSREVRLYKMPSIKDDYELDFIWNDTSDLVRSLKKGWKWNPYIKTLAFIGSGPMLVKADRQVSNFLKPTSNLYLSVKIIETKEKVNSDNPFQGVSLDEINKVSDSNKKLIFFLKSPLINEKELKFNSGYKIIEDPEEEIYKGTLLSASINRSGAVLNQDVKFFKSSSDKSNEDKTSTEIRYSSYSGKPLVLQLSGDYRESSRFLILEVKADD